MIAISTVYFTLLDYINNNSNNQFLAYTGKLPPARKATLSQPGEKMEGNSSKPVVDFREDSAYTQM